MSDPRFMAAAEGMLKLASAPVIFDAPPCPELTIQVPDLVLPDVDDAPPSSPPAQGGAEQGVPDVDLPDFAFHFPDIPDIVVDDAPYPFDDEILAAEQEAIFRANAALNASKSHFQSKYVLIKPLSEGDNGETHAAISKADVVDIASCFGADSASEAFCDAVRGCLVAVKFSKPDNLEGDLGNEIAFLRDTFPVQHKLINYHLDSHYDGDTQWLVLPFAPYGDLSSFLSKCEEGNSLSFRWHVASQLAQALLLFFFGIETNGSGLPWPRPPLRRVAHGDVFVGNTLVGAADPHDPTGFPSLILSDFGRARATCTDDNCEDCSGNAAQANDLQIFGGVLECQQMIALDAIHANEHTGDDDATCAQCEALLCAGQPESAFDHIVLKLMGFTSDFADFRDGLATLMHVVREAEEQKLKTFRPEEDGKIAAALHKPPYVSNDDLRRALGAFHR